MWLFQLAQLTDKIQTIFIGQCENRSEAYEAIALVLILSPEHNTMIVEIWNQESGMQ